MEKVKKFMFKGFNPLFVLGVVAAGWILHLGTMTILNESSWVANFLLMVGTMITVSMGIQIGRAAVKKLSVSPLELLHYAERSIIEVALTGRSIYYHLHQIRKAILLLILLYVAEEGAAAWALDQWGGIIPAAAHETILASLHVVYSLAVTITTILVIIAVTWAFTRIAILNHFSMSEELVSTIIKGLQDEGIKLSYNHGPDGRCRLNTERMLNVLANGRVKTSSRTNLYWLIKNNAELLQRIEFFPHGKPKTLVQQLAEYLQNNQCNINER